MINFFCVHKCKLDKHFFSSSVRPFVVVGAFRVCGAMMQSSFALFLFWNSIKRDPSVVTTLYLLLDAQLSGIDLDDGVEMRADASRHSFALVMKLLCGF